MVDHMNSGENKVESDMNEPCLTSRPNILTAVTQEAVCHCKILPEQQSEQDKNHPREKSSGEQFQRGSGVCRNICPVSKHIALYRLYLTPEFAFSDENHI